MKILKVVLEILFGLILAAGIFYFFWNQNQNQLTALAPINQPENNWSLLAVGDIMLSREVAVKINQFGPDYPFEKIKSLTQSTNLTVGNLESPFTTGAANTNYNSMVFGAELKSVQGLVNAGFDLLNLANNHFANQGHEGMILTFETLNQNRLDYFGAGKNFETAHQPLIRKVDQLKIAFLGYSDRDVLPANSVATENQAGLAAMDLEQMKIDLEKAKMQADLVIVSMHSGHEYTPEPNAHQIEFAHAAIDAGADLILGHHPHVVQAIEDYKGKKIFYSLGNFVFDQRWSEETQQGLTIKLHFKNTDLIKTELIPIKIENWCQPRVLEPAEPEYQKILDRIQEASEKLK